MTEPMNGWHPEPAELHAFADGEAESGRVAAHVQSCEVCRAEVAAIRRVTAMLSLGSRPADTLTERIRERRAAGEGVISIAARRERTSARRFMLPLGLAAAAALAIIVPRAARMPAPDAVPSSAGAKGAAPAGLVVQEAIVTETGPTSIDSISWDISDSAGELNAELSYLAGVPESGRAEQLARRVAEQLRESGVDAKAIRFVPVHAGGSVESPPGGAVAVIIRRAPQSGQ